MAIFAGPMMNFVLAFLIFIIVALLQGIPSNEPMLGKLTEDGVAFHAGLKEGDIVQAIDNVEISSWSDVVEVIRKSPGKKSLFQLNEMVMILKFPLLPVQAKLENGEIIGVIGVYSPTEKSALQSIKYGATETYFWTKEIFVIAWKTRVRVNLRLMHCQDLLEYTKRQIRLRKMVFIT